MLRRIALYSFACVAFSLAAQVFTLSKDQMVRYTADNPFDRFDDGRPKVPDDLLKQMQGLTVEEVWAVIRDEYPNQYEGNFMRLQPEKKLIGRAVTAQFMPYRPDVDKPAEAAATARGEGHNANQRVIDVLENGDVLVVDLMGAIEGGTFVGDNLAAAIYGRTGQGFVIDGGIRDLEGIAPLGMQGYMRGVHPSAIDRHKVMLTGLNVPVRIGNATVMPGDIVFGDKEGVYFVPPKLVKKILERALETHIHDEWTKEKMLSGQYKSSTLYPTPSDPKLKEEYEAYKAKRLAEMKGKK